MFDEPVKSLAEDHAVERPVKDDSNSHQVLFTLNLESYLY